MSALWEMRKINNTLMNRIKLEVHRMEFHRFECFLNCPALLVTKYLIRAVTKLVCFCQLCVMWFYEIVSSSACAMYVGKHYDLKNVLQLFLVYILITFPRRLCVGLLVCPSLGTITQKNLWIYFYEGQPWDKILLE